MADPFGAGEGNLFKQVLGLHAVARAGRRHTLSEEGDMSLFKTVRPNIVQSIRAFRVPELAAEAERLGQHFLSIATSFLFPKHFGKNYDALHDCLTDLVHHAGPQPGFVVVLEGLPVATKFDKDGRETLLDVFRDAAEFWAERRITFRVFYSFA